MLHDEYKDLLDAEPLARTPTPSGWPLCLEKLVAHRFSKATQFMNDKIPLVVCLWFSTEESSLSERIKEYLLLGWVLYDRRILKKGRFFYQAVLKY